ncbi:MAG: S41 family peptidase [Pirellulales bacterium]|nr:S41 family peptidase [Pirellulales bacterium]
MRRLPILAFFVCLIAASGAAGTLADEPKPETPKEDYYELHKLLVETMDEVERNYVKDISRRELIEAAIQGVLTKLDPYSSYIRPDEVDSFRSSVESEFGGIGIQLGIDDGALTVLSPLVGTPAYRAGLLAGDRIVEINGKSTEGISMDDAVRQLKGKEGTQVTLTVIHPGKAEKEPVKITREVIHVETVMGDRRSADDSWNFMLDDEKRIGYIRITAFSRNTARELRDALAQLKAKNLRALILDLRFNPGGLLPSAIEVSDLFIAEGRIVSTRGRNTEERTWNARKDGTFEGFSMAVLVNRFSASASEIVAACLQDHKRAIVVGERTWGKGSVQNVIELEDGHSALKLTTASYYRPSGKNIHRFPDAKESDQWGVMPDQGYLLKLNDREMVALMEDRKQRDVVQPKQAAEPAPESGEAASKSQSGSEETVDAKPAATDAKPGESLAASGEKDLVDPQLRMAVEYLSGELARADQ